MAEHAGHLCRIRGQMDFHRRVTLHPPRVSRSVRHDTAARRSCCVRSAGSGGLRCQGLRELGLREVLGAQTEWELRIP